MNYQEEYTHCLQDKTRQYFIENYLSTFDATQGYRVPFKLFPRQRVFLDTLSSNCNIVAIKPRQSGITTLVCGWITAQLVFASRKTPETVLCVGNSKETAQNLIEKIKDFLEQVPRWMWGGEYYHPDPENPKNAKSIFKKKNSGYVELFNGSKVYARTSGKNAARGVSAASILILDEAAFIMDGVEVYASARSCMASVGDRGRTIIVSTPNGRDPLYHGIYQGAHDKTNNFVAVEFRWYQDPRYNRNLSWRKIGADGNVVSEVIEPTISRDGAIAYDEERWSQMIRDGWKPTSPWYVDMCKSFNNNSKLIAQELDVSFLGSADNVLPTDVIVAQRNQNVIEITDSWELKDPFIKETWIWADPIPEHRYICCVDSSSGASEDRTAIEILDVDAIDENGTPYVGQVLEYYGKMTGDEIGQMVFDYASAYNNALVVLDAIGGYSDAAILTLMRMGYSNLYYDDPGLKTYTVEEKYKKFGRRSDGKLPGFRTNSVRIQMFSHFVSLVKSNGFRIRSSRVIGELETWVWKNDRPDHQHGCHDDAIYCLAMGLFVMQFHMLTADRSKKKDACILRSWRVASASVTTQSADPLGCDEVETKITRRQKELTAWPTKPTLSNDPSAASRRHNTGCLLLGGFKRKT